MTSDRCSRQRRRDGHDQWVRRAAESAKRVHPASAGPSPAIEVTVRPTGPLVGLGGTLELSLDAAGGCSFSGTLTPAGNTGRGRSTVQVVVNLSAAYAPPTFSQKPQPGNRWSWEGEAGLVHDQTLHFVMDEIRELGDVIGQVVEAMAPALQSAVAIAAASQPHACHQTSVN